ncbi:ATP-binding protein [Streptomyces xiaopingdaonensis]|uniref:ATP-binding protein n=1 Tax=Streptomyces xiaopingdaonensis TaxID=1565415 RepID=UPI000375D8BC|nr:ATP-binding protein [Streptomyces xiaopingdaonensis]
MGRPEMHRYLHLTPEVVRTTRWEVGKRLIDWGCEVVADDVVLILSELLANVLEHAGDQCELGLWRARSCLLVEVSDRSRLLPVLHDVSLGDVTGRGMQLVNALCHSWWTTPTPTGKTVGCVFRAEPAMVRDDEVPPAYEAFCNTYERDRMCTWDSGTCDSAAERDQLAREHWSARGHGFFDVVTSSRLVFPEHSPQKPSGLALVRRQE